ncbi:unnamed protein product [Jaminaea pallidilutea]
MQGRHQLSPIRGHLTTAGKQRQRTLGDGVASPKKLFKDLNNNGKQSTPSGTRPGTSAKSPAKGGPTPGPSNAKRSALGDKTNDTTKASPFGAGAGGSNVTDGKQRNASPAKSPSKVLRKPVSAAPQTPAADRSYVTQPSTKRSAMQRIQSFETPAANIGRRGMMKQRLGEIMDAQRLASVSANGPQEATQGPDTEVEHDWTHGLTVDEIYPEIEYMPPSVEAGEYVYEVPPELEGLPRASEIAALASKANFVDCLPKGKFNFERDATMPDEGALDEQAKSFDEQRRAETEKLRQEIDAEPPWDAEGHERFWPDPKEEEPAAKKATATTTPASEASASRLANGISKKSLQSARSGPTASTTGSHAPARLAGSSSTTRPAAAARAPSSATNRALGSSPAHGQARPALQSKGTAPVSRSAAAPRARAPLTSSAGRSVPAGSQAPPATASRLNGAKRTATGASATRTTTSSQSASSFSSSRPSTNKASSSQQQHQSHERKKPLKDLYDDQMSKDLDAQLKRDLQEEAAALPEGGDLVLDWVDGNDHDHQNGGRDRVDSGESTQVLGDRQFESANSLSAKHPREDL